MTTVILVTIGVILAAAAALMTVWYGGGAFDQGHINSDASRLLVEGAQIERAEGLYRAQEGHTADASNVSDPLQALIDRRYLVRQPSGDNGRWYVDYANHMIRADVGSADDSRALQICRAARRTQKLPDPGTVYHCDASDYPYAHPAGALPANEPCCTWTGATAADVGSGRGTYEGNGGSSGSGGSSGGGNNAGYDPVGSTNSYTCEQRVDFLRRSFDAIQTGTKAFYAKYGQFSNLEQMISYGYIPAWVRTATSGDYGVPSIETGFGHSPWPYGSNKPYVQVNLTEPITSCFSTTWNAKYGSQSRTDNLYGDHLSEKILLISGNPVDVTALLAAVTTTYNDIGRYVTEFGVFPGAPSQIVSSGYETAMPSSPEGTVADDFIMVARSQADANATGNKPAIHVSGVSDDVCSNVNKKISGSTDIPGWPSADRGCFFWGQSGKNEVYAYADALKPVNSDWSPSLEFVGTTSSAHFSYTSSGGNLVSTGSTSLRENGYPYWGVYLSDGRFKMHPGSSSGQRTSVVFRAPEAGSYLLRGFFQPVGGCGDGVMTSITGLPDVAANDRSFRSFSFSRTLAAGETVAFGIEMRSSDMCDMTAVDLAVAKQ